jgi:hypothetical protein
VRAALRSLGWLISEVVPAQAVRCALDRDYNHAVNQAATEFDDAELLAEREAEQEVSEPRINDGKTPMDPQWRMTASASSYVPLNEFEPPLSDDELVAVRGLIQERYPDFAGAAASLADGKLLSPPCDGCSCKPSVREDKQQANSSSLSRPAAPHSASSADPHPVDETPSPVDPSPPGDPGEGTPPISVADLRMAADLMEPILPPTDPRDYDFTALRDRLRDAADRLQAQR